MPRPLKSERLAGAGDQVCADRVVDPRAVRLAQMAMPPAEILAGATAIFAALGDPSRLRIVAALAAGELCVYDLAAVVCLSESAVSHQLRLLRDLGVVRPRRDGRRVYYALDDEHIATLIGQVVDHARHQGEERA